MEVSPPYAPCWVSSPVATSLMQKVRVNSAPAGERHTTKSASTQTELHEDVVNLSLEVERLSHKIRKMTKELDAHYKKFSDVFTKLGYLDPYSYDDEDNKVKEHLHGVWRSLYYDLDAWLGGPRRFEREKVAY